MRRDHPLCPGWSLWREAWPAPWCRIPRGFGQSPRHRLPRVRPPTAARAGHRTGGPVFNFPSFCPLLCTGILAAVIWKMWGCLMFTRSEGSRCLTFTLDGYLRLREYDVMNACKFCGKNLDLVGRAHNCVPRVVVVPAAGPAAVSVVTEAPALEMDLPVTSVVSALIEEPVAALVVGGVERLTFPASRELVGRIDEYWHRERLGSRSAAIRALIERGLG